MSIRLRLLAVVVLFATGCTGHVIIGERHAQSPETSIVRIAAERGIRDVPIDPSAVRVVNDSVGPVRLAIPFEVRGTGTSFDLPGCAIRAFRTGLIEGNDFLIDSNSIVPDPGLSVEVDQQNALIPAGAGRRIVTAILTVDSLNFASESVGLRIDDGPTALGQGLICQDDVWVTGPFVQHLGLRRIEVEPAGLGIAAGALMLFSVVLLGR